MRLMHAPFLVVMAAVLSAAGARGASEGDAGTSAGAAPGGELDADAAVRAAIAHARSLTVERAQLDRARRQAGHIPLKDVVVGVEHDGLAQLADAPPLDNMLYALSWQPPALEDIGLQQAIDAAKVDADEVELDKKARGIAAEVRRVHAHILLLREERALMRRALEVSQKLTAAMVEMLQASRATQVDASIASLDVLDIQLDLDEVDARLTRSEARFARLVGGEVAAGDDAEAGPAGAGHAGARAVAVAQAGGSTPPCTAPVGDDALFAAARARSARLRRLAIDKDALAMHDERSALRYLPWIDRVRLGYRNARPYDGKNEVQLGVDVGVPLFRLLDGYTGEAADLRRARVDAEMLEAEEDLKSDVAAKALRQRSAARLFATHQQATDAVVLQSNAAVDAALDAGGENLVGAAGVHARALKARRALLEARERCVDAVIDVWEATGDVLPAAAP